MIFELPDSLLSFIFFLDLKELSIVSFFLFAFGGRFSESC